MSYEVIINLTEEQKESGKVTISTESRNHAKIIKEEMTGNEVKVNQTREVTFS